jgi:hypothetical protein
MRELFTSERRCVHNISRMKWGVSVEPGPIIREFHPEPLGRESQQAFNSDFEIEFFDRLAATWPEHMVAAASILPNAIGAEVFLTVEKQTLSPMIFQLIEGEAFRRKHFSHLIDEVEEAVRDSLGMSDAREHAAWPQLIDCTGMRKAAFVRLMVVGTDVTFLYFPSSSVPAARGQRLKLVRGDDREIDCYVDGAECVCFDGWIRTDVTVSENVLVSLRNHE